MALAIALFIFSITGIIYGIKNENKPLLILSTIITIMLVSVWIYFYYNPY